MFSTIILSRKLDEQMQKTHEVIGKNKQVKLSQ